MQAIILGDGAMGTAIAAALRARSAAVLGVHGRPAPGVAHTLESLGERPTAATSADESTGANTAASLVAFDFSAGDGVAANMDAVLAAGCRRVIIGTTAWEGQRDAVERALVESGAAGVASASFSLGVALFARLVEEAGRLFSPFTEYDPFIVEWHRRTKPDRPSGTAKELSRRLIAAHGRKRRATGPGQTAPPDHDELEVVAIRAGASPGMHLVGFDAPGETVELRLTARDRSAYVAGALASADWLLAAPRPAGLHPFESVVSDLVSTTASN
jgi:4-hydroxy-tetrahydrodipicolinate reductase